MPNSKMTCAEFPHPKDEVNVTRTHLARRAIREQTRFHCCYIGYMTVNAYCGNGPKNVYPSVEICGGIIRVTL